MRIFESLDISERFTNPVLTIGNYDGVHVGHRQIIEKVKDEAHRLGGTSMLMTFSPHPLTVVKPDALIGLISPNGLKRRLIEEAGIDALIIVPFTEQFRLIEPEDYVKDILVDKLGIKGLIIGYDFRFGRQGRGDVDLLKGLSAQNGFFFHVVEPITLDGEKIGSNRIRKMLRSGETERAMACLGQPYLMEGRVIKGFGRGRELGFPTINIATAVELIPKEGVYVTEIETTNRRFHSVTNIGYNPTFDGKELSIETHIMDFSGDLYGCEVTLYFYKRIRDEMKFGSVEELKRRIAFDVETASDYFIKRGLE
ncbi:MAG: bifunctional riboflavin kinase/FAD synthetase [Syntrophobacterales bacterium]|jgi:riboflavin kinase/FMN adenylyltransferase|nr:bifunctional riboflavin kinase/FAD synthetase [Syntrophobacterales bacterium]